MNFDIIKAFTIKEFKQILRDKSSLLSAFLLPVVLLVLFGYGINFDTNTVKVGIVNLDNTPLSRDIAAGISNSRFLNVINLKTTKAAKNLLSGGKIRAYAVIPVNFTKEFNKKTNNAKIQIITDGSEPNTAKFASSYIQGAFNSYLEYKNSQTKPNPSSKINLIQRVWYNPSLKSVYFVLPSSLAIIMTMTGTILTALVIAREWERGTMESLLTTQITKFEFLVSKYIAYFILSFLSLLFCLFLIIFVFKVPYSGSVLALLLVSSFFLLTGLSTGLLISTLFKEQFSANQMAGTVGFMPSMMLSGLIYEIDSMPLIIRILTVFVPAKYYVSSISSLFLSGTILKTLILNSVFMLIFSILTGFLTFKITKERIEEC